MDQIFEVTSLSGTQIKATKNPANGAKADVEIHDGVNVINKPWTKAEIGALAANATALFEQMD